MPRNVNIRVEGPAVLVVGVAALGWYALKYTLWGVTKGIEAISDAIESSSSSNSVISSSTSRPIHPIVKP